MMDTVTVWIMTATTVAFVSATGGQNARQDIKLSAQSFIEKAAEGQQVEIALGQHAFERAGSEQVMQFGAQMVKDHQKARQGVEQLASREGVQLPTRLAGKHEHKKEPFSQLAVKEFDQAYMTHMLRYHKKDIRKFEEGMHALMNPQIQQWAEGTLPILKRHLQKAQQIATSIGISQQTGH